jgi:plasmid stabilization system protein ParE
MSTERSRAHPRATIPVPTVAGEVRRALLHTFPYAVYFRASDEMIVVLAVLHLRRNPK